MVLVPLHSSPTWSWSPFTHPPHGLGSPFTHPPHSLGPPSLIPHIVLVPPSLISHMVLVPLHSSPTWSWSPFTHPPHGLGPPSLPPPPPLHLIYFSLCSLPFSLTTQLTPWNVDTLSKPGFEKTVLHCSVFVSIWGGGGITCKLYNISGND